MNWEIKALILSAVFAAVLGAESGSKITVFIYNYAVVSAEVLATTEAETSRIYRHAGIEIQWLECPLSPKDAGLFPACQISGGPTRLAVRILSQSMAERLRQAEDSFGFALYPDDGSLAIVANVFAHDAEQLSNQRGISYGVILGHLFCEGFELSGSSPGMMWDQASMPDFRALSEDMALPSGEVGPVDFCALSRLALICASVGMVESSWDTAGGWPTASTGATVSTVDVGGCY